MTTPAELRNALDNAFKEVDRLQEEGRQFNIEKVMARNISPLFHKLYGNECGYLEAIAERDAEIEKLKTLEAHSTAEHQEMIAAANKAVESERIAGDGARHACTLLFDKNQEFRKALERIADPNPFPKIQLQWREMQAIAKQSLSPQPDTGGE